VLAPPWAWVPSLTRAEPVAEMPRKPKPQPDNPEQFKRFIDMARKVEVDESPGALDRALDKIMGRPQRIVGQQNPAQNRSQRKRGAAHSR
jgi:hypothetical protein